MSTIPERKEGWMKEKGSTLLKERRQRRVRVTVKLTVADSGQKNSSTGVIQLLGNILRIKP